MMRKSAALMLAAGVATAAVGFVPEAEARPWGWGGWGYARPWGGYYRSGWGWGGGGALAAGLAIGAAGGLIASSLATPAYAYGYPGYGWGYPSGYGYGYGYPAAAPVAYGYPATTVAYEDPAPVVVRRRVVYRTPVYRSRIAVRRAYGPVAVYRPRARLYGSAVYRQRVTYGARPAYRVRSVAY